MKTRMTMRIDWPEFSVGEQHCPACGCELDRATAVQHDCSPKDGDVTVCIKCGTYLAFAGALGLQVVDAEAFAGLPADVQDTLRRVRAAVFLSKLVGQKGHGL